MDFFPQARKNISELWDNITDDVRGPVKANTMKTDIYEKEGNLIIETELPGVSKEDISVDYKNDYLTITARSSFEKDLDSRRYVKRERTYGEYVRRFYVDGVIKDEITAAFSDGILKVTMPKPEVKKTYKSINID
ncbi:Hsp20/alpha crystallin family protein [Mycoplasmatota bacterium WC44]